ncbi:MAG TPA: hypothetical protein PLP08_07335, partial [Plasticicumulans sp.]|uniref:hypothetical protein n=1 Tax=Plasticicumulans sp. TaxID=2307179 RepID=UPI002B8E61A5
MTGNELIWINPGRCPELADRTRVRARVLRHVDCSRFPGSAICRLWAAAGGSRHDKADMNADMNTDTTAD